MEEPTVLADKTAKIILQLAFMFTFDTILMLPHKFTIKTCDGLFHMVTHKKYAITYSYSKCALKYLNSTFFYCMCFY